jgi:hypothetical protein
LRDSAGILKHPSTGGGTDENETPDGENGDTGSLLRSQKSARGCFFGSTLFELGNLMKGYVGGLVYLTMDGLFAYRPIRVSAR